MEENKNPNPQPTEVKASKTSDKSMPSIRQLLEESWHLLTQKVLKILLISVYTLIGIVSTYLIAALLGVVIFFSLVGGTGDIQNAAASLIGNPAMWTAGGLLLVALIVAVSIISLMAQAGLVLTLSEKDETASSFSLFKKGWIYVLPLFIVGLIEFVIIFGSVFLFIIPAIIISIFLAFTLYTVVLENKKGMEAIKMSVGIVQQQFGAIVGRFVLYFLLVMAVMIVLAALSSISEEVAALAGLVRFIVNFFVNWFGLVFTFQVYKHARAAYDESQPVSLTWMWIVSAVGWVIAGLIITVAVQAVGKINPEEIMKKAVEENQRMELDIDQSGEYIPEMPSDDADEFYNMFDEETQRELRQLQQMQDGSEI